MFKVLSTNSLCIVFASMYYNDFLDQDFCSLPKCNYTLIWLINEYLPNYYFQHFFFKSIHLRENRKYLI